MTVEIRHPYRHEIVGDTLDSLIFKDRFRHYEQLFKLNPRGILVAVDRDVVGVIASERISEGKILPLKEQPFPPLDHDPIHDEGHVSYIAGFSVKNYYRERGIGDLLVRNFLNLMKEQGYNLAAVLYNIGNPDLRDAEIWRKHGFRPLRDTRDKRWKQSADKPVDECIFLGKYLR